LIPGLKLHKMSAKAENLERKIEFHRPDDKAAVSSKNDFGKTASERA